MADMNSIDLEAILKRLEDLEKENHSLRAEVEELKSNDIEIKAELNTINRFISAMTESQSIDEVMTEIESAAKQLTDSDKVTFYCMDSVNNKFFAEDEGRNWIPKEQAEKLKSISDKQEIQNCIYNVGPTRAVACRKAAQNCMPNSRFGQISALCQSYDCLRKCHNARCKNDRHNSAHNYLYGDVCALSAVHFSSDNTLCVLNRNLSLS